MPVSYAHLKVRPDTLLLTKPIYLFFSQDNFLPKIELLYKNKNCGRIFEILVENR
mgnify:CR=1 FL=1